jgi:hypothetical protein
MRLSGRRGGVLCDARRTRAAPIHGGRADADTASHITSRRVSLPLEADRREARYASDGKAAVRGAARGVAGGAGEPRASRGGDAVTFDSTPDAELAAQYSALCGYPLEDSITGRITFVSWTTQSGTRRQLELQSVLLTLTNPATGESLTVRNAFQSNISLNGVPGGRGEVTFLYVQPGGTDASAGRRDLRFTVGLDAEGNVTGITGITLDDRTANLTGLGALVCPALAA